MGEQICTYVSKFSNDMFICSNVWKKLLDILLTLMEEIYYHSNGSKYEKGDIDIMNLNHMVVQSSTSLHDEMIRDTHDGPSLGRNTRGFFNLSQVSTKEEVYFWLGEADMIKIKI